MQLVVGTMEIALSPNRIDYYRMLGLDASAPLEAIQGAYKILARRLHPDITGDPSTAEAMTRANSLFQTLMARPVPSDFKMDTTPALRRSQDANEPMSRYRQVMDATETIGQFVDVFA
jgi:DnaJ-class molecular chaperone